MNGPRPRLTIAALLCFTAGCGQGASRHDADSSNDAAGAAGAAGADAASVGTHDAAAEAPDHPAAAGAAGSATGAAGAAPKDAGSEAAASPDTSLSDAPYDVTPAQNDWPGSIPVMAAAKAPAGAGDPVCYASGWCWSDPAPLGGDLAVWSVAANDVWVVGPHGTARHFDGQVWTNTNTGTTIDLVAVWGSATDAVWATGTSPSGIVLRWNGTKWSTLDSGVSSGGAILTGSGPNDLWVGGSGLDHFDGKTWTSPTAIQTSDAVETSDGALYAAVSGVGNTTGLGELQPRPGATFEITDSQTALGPNGVWASSPTDVWLAHPFALLRYDGGVFRTALTMPTDAAGPQLQQVRGSDATHVWIAAIDGSMLRWNGASFERWPSGTRYAKRIAARAADDVWMAGAAGALSRFDGTAWQRQGTQAQLGEIDVLEPVGPDETWALGYDFDVPAIIRHRADGSWQEVPSAFPLTAFSAVWGSSADDVWVAGVEEVVDGVPLLAHWDGSGWSRPLDLPEKGGYDAVWGSARDDVWAAGADLRRWDGAAWHVVTAPTDVPVMRWTALTGTGQSDVWASAQVQGGFRTLEWNGTKWTDRTPPIDTNLLAARAPNDVFAWSGTALTHFDGQKWTTLLDEIQGVGTFAARAGELWRLAPDSSVSSWNGATWTLSDTLGADCTHVAAAAHDVWIGCGFGGAGVMHLAR